MNTDKIYAESIMKEYAVKDNSRVIALRKLDAKVKKPATVFALSFGMFACLCLSMKVIGGTDFLTFSGVVIGILGFIGMGINYSIYKKLLEKRKMKYAFEIIELAKKISQEE